MKNVKNVALVCLLVCGCASSVSLADTILFRNGLAVGSETYMGTADATMNIAAPDKAYGSAYWPLYIRGVGANNDCTTLIKFGSLENYVPENFQVESVRVGLTGFYAIPSTITVKVGEMLKSWNNASLTWNVDGLGSNWAAGGALGTTANGSIPADRADELMGSITIPGGTVPAGQTVWIDIAPAVVQKWIDQPQENNGMVFFSDSPNYPYFYVVGRIGTGGTYPEQRPQLEITGTVVPEPMSMVLLAVGTVALIRTKKN